MEPDDDALKRQIAKMEADLAALKQKAAARAAAPPPAAAPAAPTPAKAPRAPRAAILRPAEAYPEHVIGLRGHDLALFSAAHREAAANPLGMRARDHLNWKRYFHAPSGAFVLKSRKVNGERQYYRDLKSGVVEAPIGSYFNTATQRFVKEDTVFTAKGTLRPAYAHKTVVGRLIKDRAERGVTVSCFLFAPLTYKDAQGNERPMRAEQFKAHRDGSLAHVVDPDGEYHREINEMVINTTEGALAPWLPAGRVWWFHGAHFPDHVSIDTIKEAPISKAANSRRGGGSSLNVAVDTFSSRLSALSFRNVVYHEEAPAHDVLTLQNHGTPRGVYSPVLDVGVNPAAQRLEEWLLLDYDPAKDEYVNKRPGAVAMPSDTGCVYDFIISTYAPSFATLRAKKDESHPYGRHHEVEMTPRWLYEHVFHPGKPYDEGNLGLSLGDTKKFFIKFRLSLFVLDVTGRLVLEACYEPEHPQANNGNAIRPLSAYMVVHNEHVYPVNAEMKKRLTALMVDANSFIWSPLKVGEALNEEDAVVAAPSSRFNVNGDNAPLFFLPNIDAIAGFNLHVQKTTVDGALRVNKAGEPIYHDRLRVAVPASMAVVLKEFYDRAKYQPKVSLNSLGAIQSLTLKVDGVKVCVSSPNYLVPEPSPDDATPSLPTKEIFLEYCEHDKAFRNALRNSETLSCYSPSLAKAFEPTQHGSQHYRPLLYRSPLRYGLNPTGDVTAVDRVKSYTSLLREMNVVPVFTPFCVFESPPYLPRLCEEVAVSDDEPCAFFNDSASNASDPSTPQVKSVLKVKPLKGEFALGSSASRTQGVLAFGDEGWREYSEKTLRDVARGMYFDKKQSRRTIFNTLTVEMKQPPLRASLAVTHGTSTERERHGFYLVMVTGTIFPDDPRFLLLDQEYCLVTFDTWAIVREWPCVATLGRILPFHLAKTGIAKITRSLWTSSLSADLKKFIPNKNVGVCGKTDNVRSDTITFTNLAEAKAKAAEFGEEVTWRVLGDTKFYFVTREWNTPLAEGYFPIHHAVLDAQRRVLYEKALEMGGRIVGVDTDCLFFEGHNPAQDVPKRNTYDAIGSWASYKGEMRYKKPPFARKFSDDMLPPMDNTPYVNVLRVKDEFDTDEFAALFSEPEYRNLLVLADVPGAGKTHALLKFCAPLGDAALFVTPYNALADDLVKHDDDCAGGACSCVRAHAAITFHRLLGLHAQGEEPDEEEEEESKKKRGYDISKVSHVVFDEVFCYTPKMLAQQRRFMLKNATMEDGTPRSFYSAGDPNQNAPIVSTCLSRPELSAYYMRAVSSLFPNQIRLSICKRVSTDAERALMTEIKDLVLHSEVPLMEICRNYFKPITRLSQVKGRAVCYTNESARVVNEHRQKAEAKKKAASGVTVHNVDGRLYYVGQVLRARKYYKKPRLFVNYCYKVEGFQFSATGAVTGVFLSGIDGFAWPVALARAHFIYDFAATCHSLQGLSASDGVTLFDVEGWYCSRPWFYTALTRTRCLAEVYFWDVKAVGPVTGQPAAQRADFVLALEATLAGHRAADTAKGRTWEEGEYVDGAAISEMLAAQNGQCAWCAAFLPPRWTKKDGNGASIDRIDNARAHTKDNCCLACLHCQHSRNKRT